MEYDIALIELTKNVTLSDKISFICVNNFLDLEPYDFLYVAGWGITEKYSNFTCFKIIKLLKFKCNL